MGWKNFKKHFGIEHNVQMTADGLCIGSSYVHNLAVVDVATGAIRENQVFSRFLTENYPTLKQATPQEILDVLNEQDTFTKSIPIYTYEDGKIIEKQCEVLGYPNVTHDGLMMYENTFSIDKQTIIDRAKEVMTCNIKHDLRNIQELEQKLASCKDQLAIDEADLLELETNYPAVEGELV